VRLVDPTIEGHGLEATLEEACARPARLVGLSAHADQTVSLEETVALVGGLRRRGFEGPVCLGGYGVSLRYADYLEALREATVVVGDGETPLPEVVDRLLHGRGCAGIPGVAVRRADGTVDYTRARRAPSLDAFPPPARDLLLPRLERHGRRTMSYVRAGSGCHHNCSYCSMEAYLGLMDGKRYLKRAVPAIVDEIEGLARDLGVENFTLLDENFVLPNPQGIARLRAFRDELRARGLEINLHIQTRPDSISARAVDILAECGMKSIFIGIESVHPHDLEVYNRSGGEHIEPALEVLGGRGYGVDIYSPMRCHVGYIGFHPFSTTEALEAGARFFQRHRMPPKRLLQRLRIQDHTRIREMTAAAGLLRMEHHTSYRDRREVVFDYQHPEVGVIYDTIQRLIADYYGWRERLRRIEKCLQFAPDAVDLGPLKGASAAIDRLLLDILADLCREARRDPDFRHRLEDHYRDAAARLEGLLSERGAHDGIPRLEAELRERAC